MGRVLNDIAIATHRILTRLSLQAEPAAAAPDVPETARIAAILDAFDAMQMAALLLDRSLSVVGSNGTAGRLLDAELRVVRGRLVSADREATATLERVLQAVVRNQSSAEPVMPVPLPRNGRRPLLAYPRRLRVLSSGLLAQCLAVVLMVDLEKDQRPQERTLGLVFQLTPAEARLAAGLASGRALSEVATELGVGKETARAQLKSVFGKMGVRRQSELVAVLARLPDEGNFLV
jgi:DNA-binding CsgD family transcriptional regulator